MACSENKSNLRDRVPVICNRLVMLAIELCPHRGKFWRGRGADEGEQQGFDLVRRPRRRQV
jgi:hypothetical protein